MDILSVLFSFIHILLYNNSGIIEFGKIRMLFL